MFLPTGGYADKLRKKLQTHDKVWVMQMGYGARSISHNAPNPLTDNWIYQTAYNIHYFNQLSQQYTDKYNVKIDSTTKIATLWQFGSNDLGVWETVKNNFVADYVHQVRDRFDDGKDFISTIPAVLNPNGKLLQPIVNAKILEVIDITKSGMIDHRNISNPSLYGDEYHMNDAGAEVLADNAYKVLKPYFFDTPNVDPNIPPTYREATHWDYWNLHEEGVVFTGLYDFWNDMVNHRTIAEWYGMSGIQQQVIYFDWLNGTTTPIIPPIVPPINNNAKIREHALAIVDLAK